MFSPRWIDLLILKLQISFVFCLIILLEYKEDEKNDLRTGEELNQKEQMENLFL